MAIFESEIVFYCKKREMYTMYTLIDNYYNMSTTKDAVMSFRVPADMKQQVEKIAKELRRTP
jgi:hypothetical protein